MEAEQDKERSNLKPEKWGDRCRIHDRPRQINVTIHRRSIGCANRQSLGKQQTDPHRDRPLEPRPASIVLTPEN
ncbi:MAG: hypothetical protein WBA24_08285 [Geitlerinemataceae cyanobacterium]